MSDRPPAKPGNPVLKFLGGALMAVGGMIALLSGLCSLGVVGMSLMEAMGSHGSADAMFIVIPALIFGGVPFAIGLGIFLGGRALYRAN